MLKTATNDDGSELIDSYAELGLLPSIPLPTGASSSKSHKAAISLPPTSTSNSASNPGEEITPKVSYGRIIRDEDGNVIDIILDDEDEDEGEAGAVEQEGRGALNPKEEYVPERVEAKTDVVRCKPKFEFLIPPSSGSSFGSSSYPWIKELDQIRRRELAVQVWIWREDRDGVAIARASSVLINKTRLKHSGTKGKPTRAGIQEKEKNELTSQP